MTTSFLSEGEVGVGLTLQCLEECDRALAQEGDGEQCLKALEPEFWALCQRVQAQTALLEARWDCVDESEEAGGRNRSHGVLLATAWDDLHESVWTVARYETMTPVGLRAKGKCSETLWTFPPRWRVCLRCRIRTCETSITSLIVDFTAKTRPSRAVPSTNWRAILVRAGPSYASRFPTIWRFTLCPDISSSR